MSSPDYGGAEEDEANAIIDFVPRSSETLFVYEHSESEGSERCESIESEHFSVSSLMC
jgi:hypothetical protein